MRPLRLYCRIRARLAATLAITSFMVCGCGASLDWRDYVTDPIATVAQAGGEVIGRLAEEASNAIAARPTFDRAAWITTAIDLALRYGFPLLGRAAAHLLGDLVSANVAGPVVARCHHPPPELRPYLEVIFSPEVERAGRGARR